MLIRRGFVAAPLIGTIIFLAAIMFAVNLSKTDSAEVSHVVSDAYHNRIVSLLEMYRADLGAVFTVGLSRNVEYFLTGQCWASPPFNIETSGNQGSQPQALLDIKNQAYDNCVLFNKILKAVVCSIDPKYGMKAWLSQMNETTTFEGISFEPANKQSFERFITTGWSTSSLNLNNQQYASGSGSCEDLVMGSLFDCYAFAYETLPGGGPKLQCCNETDATDASGNPKDCVTRGGGVVDGCESGIFYVGLRIEQQSIFPYMPRIKASDGLGNEIRSGALADKDFAIPVNYPLFKYYGDAFKFYREMAFSGTGTSSPRGIMNGLCYEQAGAGGCPSGTGRTPTVTAAATGASSVEEASAEQEFFQLFQHANQSMVDVTSNPKYNVSLEAGSRFIDSNQDVSHYLNNRVSTQNAITTSAAYAHVKEVRLTVKFNDTDSTYQVDSAQPNQFCWLAHPSFQ